MAGTGKKRNYSKAFFKVQDRPQCFIFNKVLTNESLKPSKLEAHLKKCHPVLQNKARDFFERKAKCLKGIQFGAQESRGQQLLAAVEASCVVAYKAEVYIGSGAGFQNQDYPVFSSDSDWIRIVNF